MEVVALVPALDHVCTRYRVLQFKNYFQQAGISLTIEQLAPTFRLRIRQMLRRRKIVLLQRKLIPEWQFGLLRRTSEKIIYDFDDAVFLRDSFDNVENESLTRKRRFAKILRGSDLIIAGNPFLAQAAGKVTSGDKVVIVPTCVESNAYPVAAHAEKEEVKLVWIGSKSMLRSLGRAAALFEAIGRAVPGLTLRVICNSFPAFRNLRVERVTWSEDSERTELANSDVGISWLPDDEWSRGKCGLKVLQYMAAGLPVIASPVGVHPDLIGASGVMPSSQEEWVAAVRQLVSDATARRDMGREARTRIETHFDAKNWGPILANQLRETVGLA